ncbi:MAPEG family protein [Paraurantiacibacter namhicola]|uniref:Inner membrane protein YecN n=1 Tax=Paraurantiacibacter namhicola TaxID=645517 RepID=A0A1C7DA13_9SPHN|nr:MAPEG family protein [Paraurantiacibacter namhicola]ANU08326.1 Inner membrane protein YecN [Paraurantiacibacter namhicola]
MILPATLTVASGAALITIWHMARIGRMRLDTKTLHGDGGNELLQRRMRAQLNFVESAPFVLALLAVLEIAGKGGLWLLIIGIVYLMGRVAHAIGMDGDYPHRGRQAGTMITMATLLILAGAGLWLTVSHEPSSPLEVIEEAAGAEPHADAE